MPPLLFTEHHQAHAASAFFPSPFDRAAVLCLDGVGEWATTSLWLGEGNRLTAQWEIDFPHSLGLLYSAFTYYTGFKVNSGEYKLMGLAPYGEPKYASLILDHLIDLKPDGTFRLNSDYFNYATGLTMTSGKFDELFGAPPRQPESPLTQREMDLASSIQAVTEEVVLRLARTARKELERRIPVSRRWRRAQLRRQRQNPARRDFSRYLGPARRRRRRWRVGRRARRMASLQWRCAPRDRPRQADQMRGTFLGPRFDADEIRRALDSAGAIYEHFEDDDELLDRVADAMSHGAVVGWFDGRMEFGPRALGARSIIGDARDTRMQSVMNLKIKYRESFRPFAPSVLDERVGDYFELDRPSPYMALVAPVREELRTPMTPDQERLFGIEKLNVPRSTIPAVTHVDYSARIQTVHRETNPRYHELIRRFEALTGCGVIVNTSFNVRGEPIVCTPEDAYRCFMRTEMDFLVVGDYLMAKGDQPERPRDESWRQQFELD